MLKQKKKKGMCCKRVVVKILPPQAVFAALICQNSLEISRMLGPAPLGGWIWGAEHSGLVFLPCSGKE